MASIISGLVTSLLEFDEVSVSRVGDEVEYTILTTGIMPSVVELKTLIWSYLAPPVKRLEVVSIEEVESGPLTKRYQVVVRGKAVSPFRFRRGLRR